MKKIILLVISIAAALALMFFIFGKYVAFIGKRESGWIIEDMWSEKYFGARSGELKENELIYLKSLFDGASKDQRLISYVVKNKCYDATWDCSIVMMSASNLMIDAKDYDTGLRGAIEAYERVRGQCPIIYESVILRYKLEKLSNSPYSVAASKAKSILNKIKHSGGLMSDLRTTACKKLLKEKPEYFTTYALLTSKLMELSGGRDAKAAAYINSLPK